MAATLKIFAISFIVILSDPFENRAGNFRQNDQLSQEWFTRFFPGGTTC